MTPQADEIIGTEIIPRFRNSRGRFLLLYGENNTGKSFLLKYAASLIRKIFPDTWAQSLHPIIRLNLHDGISSTRQFYIYLLEQSKCQHQNNFRRILQKQIKKDF
ncbi:MAG: hypothetical protein ACTSRK_17715 [Promethearchaeota archaeon]